MPPLPDQLFAAQVSIDAIELLCVDVHVPRQFSFGTWHNRQHGILRIRAGGQWGVAETLLAANRRDLRLVEAITGLEQLCGRPLGEALAWSQDHPDAFGPGRIEPAQIAMLDLEARLAGVPLLSHLGLPGRDPVALTPTILSADPEQVAAAARDFQRQGCSHLKIKLFGDPVQDLALVQAARGAIEPSTYLSGDVNGGYGGAGGAELRRALPELVAVLGGLLGAGLNGCEDPAELEPRAWQALAEAVRPLELIADVVLRPASRALGTCLQGMAGRYNIHPDCTGSMLDALRLIQLLRGRGESVVIGDNSFVGPGCPFWQSIAIGAGAAWCEAAEKPQECPGLEAAQYEGKLGRDRQGRVLLDHERPGTGVSYDEQRLHAAAANRVQWLSPRGG